MTAAFVGEWALRSAILIATGALLLRALRVKDPAIRLAAYLALLVGSLAIPLLTAALPRIALATAVPAATADARLVSSPALSPGRGKAARAGEIPPLAAPQAFDWLRLLWTGYLVVAAALLLRLTAGLAIGRRLVRASRATGTPGIRESDAVAAPVVLGIWRPVILLPADWHKWDAVRLDAVLAHERAHVDRRDPAVQLLAAIHRALLWHSPLSWFLHRWIVRAAEEASDDAAVAATCDRALYAETLLAFMQGSRAEWGIGMARYGSPEERIHRVLDGTAISRGVTRWTAAAILLLIAPLAYVVAATQTGAPQSAAEARSGNLPSFDVASVKSAEPLPLPGPDGMVMLRAGTGAFPSVEPGRIHYPRESMMRLLTNAFAVQNFQIQGPQWLSQDTFEIDATMPPDTTPPQVRLMWQNLLAERFHLAVHRETKEFAGYSLVVARSGLKLKEGSTAPSPVAGGAPLDQDGFPVALGYGRGAPRPGGQPSQALGFFGPLGRRFFFEQRTTGYLAGFLAQNLRCPVSDDTALTAPYDFTLTYLPEGQAAPPDGNYPPAPDLFTALEKQLGLRLEKKKINAELVVVDRIDRTPTAN